MSAVIVCRGVPGVVMGPAKGRDPLGAYLSAFDPDARDGMGQADWTYSRDEAMVFTDHAAAVATYLMPSSIRPLRDDGLPNKPLTAYSVEIKEMDE